MSAHTLRKKHSNASGQTTVDGRRWMSLGRGQAPPHEQGGKCWARGLKARGRPAGLCAAMPRGQRLGGRPRTAGEEGGGKLSSSSTATPTLLGRVNMQDAGHPLAGPRGCFLKRS